jgi:hypothetical protein
MTPPVHRRFLRRREGHGTPAVIQDAADASEVHEDPDTASIEDATGDATSQEVDFLGYKRWQ